MGKFFLNGETHRIEFPDGEWVDIKPEFSQADLDYITAKMMQARVAVESGKKPETQVDMVFGRQATLERGVLAWSFKDDAGQPVSLTSENLCNLRSRYRSQVLAEIDRLNSEAASFSKNS